MSSNFEDADAVPARVLLGSALPAEARPDGYRESCPCRPLLDRLSDRWTSEVIPALLERPHGFGDLRRRLGVSHKVLTETLRALQRDGFIDRAVGTDNLRTVTYSLTSSGEDLIGPLVVMRDWAQQHSAGLAAAQQRYDQGDAPASVTVLRQRDHER